MKLKVRKEKDMYIEMQLQVKFNRAIDPDKDYISTGGFIMMMNGKAISFDFNDEYRYVDNRKQEYVSFVLKNPDYEEFKEFQQITLDEFENITKINDCYVFTGEEGESDLQVQSIKSINFHIIEGEKILDISVDKKVIDSYNDFVKNEMQIVKAAFTSVWDTIAVTTPCKVNMKTGEVFDIEVSPVEVIGSLEEEYITLHGKDYPVHGESDITNEKGEYWYGAVKAYFYRLDSSGHSVYKCEDGQYIKDMEVMPNKKPLLYYCNANDCNGDAECMVDESIKLLPFRVCCQQE